MKIPEGSTPCPRAGAEAGVRREAPNGGRSGGPRARRAARGDFQNPRTGDGDLGKIPDQKSEFCIYFFLIIGTNSRISYKSLTTSLLAYIIFFLSFRRKEFYKNVSFCQLVYFLKRTNLEFFSAREETG